LLKELILKEKSYLSKDLLLLFKVSLF